jgi:hypothetical protein
MRLQLKFRDGVPEEERASVLEEIKAAKATPEPLFPGESDPELASLYTVEDVPDTDADALVRSVGSRDWVEFIERGEKRRLIR